MSFRLLTPELVELIHDEVLNPGEIPGRAQDNSLEGTLARIDHRLNYGMIADEYDLAAAYAVAIAVGHCFNDASKRTAFRSMHMVLMLNCAAAMWPVEEIGPLIIRVAQGLVDEADLAAWLRARRE